MLRFGFLVIRYELTLERAYTQKYKNWNEPMEIRFCVFVFGNLILAVWRLDIHHHRLLNSLGRCDILESTHDEYRGPVPARKSSIVAILGRRESNMVSQGSRWVPNCRSIIFISNSLRFQNWVWGLWKAEKDPVESC
jgi:hypothetical protein